MNDRQACAMQSKLNVMSRKTVHYCILAAQREVTRPSFSRRLKGVACETSMHIGQTALEDIWRCFLWGKCTLLLIYKGFKHTVGSPTYCS